MWATKTTSFLGFKSYFGWLGVLGVSFPRYDAGSAEDAK